MGADYYRLIDSRMTRLKVAIPICVYKGALKLAFDVFLSKAKNAVLTTLGQGFLTHEKEKSIKGYAPLYKCIGIIWSMCLLMSSVTFGQVPIVTGVDFERNEPNVKVILAGSGFSTDPAQMVVLFGGVAGTVTTSSDLNVEVTPPANAKYDHVTVLNTASGFSATTNFKYFTSFGGDTFDADAYALSATYTTLVPQHDLCICDFNLDGKNDIASTKINTGPNDISIYDNQSTGAGSIVFSQFDGDDLSSLNIGEPTRNIICGDINNDGLPDLIISGNLSGNRNKIHLLINNSTGGNISFESKLTLFSPDGSTAIRLAVHDLNGDGKSDIVVVDRENNKVFVFRNISTSGVSFDTPLEIVVNGAVKFWGLEVQDMDGDGKADLVLNQFQDNNVFIVRNTSAGNTISFDDLTTIDLPITIRNIKTGYLDEDDKLDIIVTHESTDEISIIQNNSTPENISFSTIGQFDTSSGAAPWGIDLADGDGDGDLDIFIGNKDTNVIDVFVNNSAGSAIALEKQSITTSLGTRNLAIADFDGDAKADLALTSSVDDGTFYTLEIWRNEHCLVPTIYGESNLTICDQDLEITSTSSVGGALYEWFKDGASTPEKSGTENFILVQPADVVATTTYQLRTTDATGCIEWASETISIEPNGGAAPITPAILSVAAVCEGEDVTLEVASADDVNLTYAWTGPNDFVATGSSVEVVDFTEENVGEYILKASSGPCLSGETSIIVNKKGIPVIDVLTSGATTFCVGESVALSTNNNSIITDYKWFDANGNIGTNNTIDITASGAYYAELIADGCLVSTSTINVTVFTLPTASFTMSNVSGCIDEEITFTNASTVDGAANVAYAWDFGDGATSDQESPTYTYSTGSIYNVSLEISYEGVSCIDSQTEAVTINEPSALVINSDQLAICPEEELVLSIDASNTDIVWTNGASTPDITVIGGGTYEVSALDVNGCNVSATIDIASKDLPIVTVSPEEHALVSGESIQLEASGADAYSWSPMEGLDDPTISSPIASPTVSTIYTVEGTVTDGCAASTSVAIEVTELSGEPPKILSVNNTSGLSSWQIANPSASSCALSIFNRNGSMVFEGSGNVVEWDGTDAGKELPQGTYFYVFTCDDGQPKTGSILLMKL
jgi:gliding motility-associated-like protein